MRNILARWLVGSLLVSVVGACVAQRPAPAPSVDTGAITASLDSINKAFAAAVTARDTDAVAAFYADDARVLPPGMARADGHAAIRAMWAEFLKAPDLELSLTNSTPLVSEAGDMIVDVGSYDMKWKGPRGKPVDEVGKYVTVYKKVNGEWKIVVDTFNGDKAPAM